MAKNYFYDITVVGAGAAALAAVWGCVKEAKIALVTGNPAKNSTYFAQGGIAIATGKDDSPKLHVEDTLEAGRYINNKRAVEILATEGIKRVLQLDRYYPFLDRDNGIIKLTKEGGHRKARVAHAKGDRTGKFLRESLIKVITKEKNITLFHSQVESILADEKGVAGVITDRGEKIISRAVILATGGIGALFKKRTSPNNLQGTLYSQITKLGGNLSDMEFVQFHPTALNIKSATRLPLISEAVRGEGAIIVNAKEKPINVKHPMRHLAPRDVLARTIWEYESKGEKLFLDARKIKTFPTRFPFIYALLRKFGIDPSKDLIPITSSVHYHMGGIETDEEGKTNIPGLWVVGEAAATGVHGANRLGSNSLLECLVFGFRAGKSVNTHIYNETSSKIKPTYIKEKQNRHDIRYIREEISNSAGLIRDKETLLKAIEKLKRKYRSFYNLPPQAFTIYSVLLAALLREESRGAHFRKDYTEENDKFKTRSHLNLKKLKEWWNNL